MNNKKKEGTKTFASFGWLVLFVCLLLLFLLHKTTLLQWTAPRQQPQPPPPPFSSPHKHKMNPSSSAASSSSSSSPRCVLTPLHKGAIRLQVQQPPPPPPGEEGASPSAVGRLLTAAQVVSLWANDPSFSLHMSRTILQAAASSFSSQALFFECAPVDAATFAAAEHPLECMLLEAPSLARFAAAANRRAFAEHWPTTTTATKEGGGVVHFQNLGGDAVLITPVDPSSSSTSKLRGERCGHLLSFLREALEGGGGEGEGERLVATFWQRVGEQYRQRVEGRQQRPVWLSTSGLGVAWLHMRLDDRPKYYSWAPYRQWPPQRKQQPQTQKPFTA